MHDAAMQNGIGQQLPDLEMGQSLPEERAAGEVDRPQRQGIYQRGTVIYFQQEHTAIDNQQALHNRRQEGITFKHTSL